MVTFDISYLNRTPHKTRRMSGGFKPKAVICHETAGYGSLEWNLRPDVKASFNYLITRNGRIYHYVDEQLWIAWHAGISSRWVLDNQSYVGGAINTSFIGVELEGPNDGTPITTAQRTSMIDLMRYFRDKYGIPLAASHYPEHRDVAPGYKSDAEGYSATLLVDMANAGITPKPVLPDTTPVIGVAPNLSFEAFNRAMKRHSAPLSDTEARNVYNMCVTLEVDPAFLIALWKHEGGSPFGSSELQQESRNPLNIKTTWDDWRHIVKVPNTRQAFFWFESFQLGLLSGIIHLKNYYGSMGVTSIRAIIERFAPASDGNNPDGYIRSVQEDMIYIRNN